MEMQANGILLVLAAHHTYCIIKGNSKRGKI